MSKRLCFERGIGAATDVVGKEMYTFTDKGDRSCTLRPEGTAGVVRAFIQHSLFAQGGVQRLWYTGPMYRYERPQKGRQRQFHQVGVELIGSHDPPRRCGSHCPGHRPAQSIGIAKSDLLSEFGGR